MTTRLWPAWRAPHRLSPGVALAAVVVALITLIPVGFVIQQALATGSAEAQRLLFRPKVADLLSNTVRLTLTVTIATAALGLAVAWLTERTDLPGRKVWSVLAALPI